jgi:hypothetical protein
MVEQQAVRSSDINWSAGLAVVLVFIVGLGVVIFRDMNSPAYQLRVQQTHEANLLAEAKQLVSELVYVQDPRDGTCYSYGTVDDGSGGKHTFLNRIECTPKVLEYVHSHK